MMNKPHPKFGQGQITTFYPLLITDSYRYCTLNGFISSIFHSFIQPLGRGRGWAAKMTRISWVAQQEQTSFLPNRRLIIPYQSAGGSEGLGERKIKK